MPQPILLLLKQVNENMKSPAIAVTIAAVSEAHVVTAIALAAVAAEASSTEMSNAKYRIRFKTTEMSRNKSGVC